MPKRWMLLIVLTVSICGITWVILKHSHEAPSLANSTLDGKDLQTGPVLSPRVLGPGSHIASPAAPVAAVSASKTAGNSTATALTADTVGKFQPVRADTNAQTALIASAVKAHQDNHLSLLAAATPFDAAAFKLNPEGYAQAYAQDVQPSRVYQTAAPGAGVPVLTAITSTQVEMPQDGLLFLRVRTVPSGPVSWVTTDGGTFQNHLAAMTVVADSHGVASVAYTAGPGTIDGVKVLAGSPLSVGQIQFYIQVTASSHANVSSAH